MTNFSVFAQWFCHSAAAENCEVFSKFFRPAAAQNGTFLSKFCRFLWRFFAFLHHFRHFLWHFFAFFINHFYHFILILTSRRQNSSTNFVNQTPNKKETVVAICNYGFFFAAIKLKFRAFGKFRGYPRWRFDTQCRALPRRIRERFGCAYPWWLATECPRVSPWTAA